MVCRISCAFTVPWVTFRKRRSTAPRGPPAELIPNFKVTTKDLDPLTYREGRARRPLHRDRPLMKITFIEQGHGHATRR